MKYTHLFFDLDNTLWDFNANSYDALLDALKKTKLLERIGDFDPYFFTSFLLFKLPTSPQPGGRK